MQDTRCDEQPALKPKEERRENLTQSNKWNSGGYLSPANVTVSTVVHMERTTVALP